MESISGFFARVNRRLVVPCEAVVKILVTNNLRVIAAKSDKLFGRQETRTGNMLSCIGFTLPVRCCARREWNGLMNPNCR